MNKIIIKNIYNFMEKNSYIIGTHSGCFHADEVLACTMLTKFTKKFRDAMIVRTRDPKLLETFDIVVDVGGVYDPSKGLFDHH